jgi:hypothetical protein
MNTIKDFWWILCSFGIRAGLRFAWDTFCLKLNRLFRRDHSVRMEDLSDEEVEQIAREYEQSDVYRYGFRDNVKLSQDWDCEEDWFQLEDDWQRMTRHKKETLH